MAYEEPDNISSDATAIREVAADGANLFVTIEGSNFLLGQAALERAHEVRQLVTNLKEFGLLDKDIGLVDVKIRSRDGKISKTTYAEYSLVIRRVALDQVAHVIGIIAANKNTTLSELRWHYPTNANLINELLDEAIDTARTKAERIAERLGVKLLGIFSLTFNDEDEDEEDPRTCYYRIFRGGDNRPDHSVTPEDFGLSIAHSKKQKVTVSIVFRVSQFNV